MCRCPERDKIRSFPRTSTLHGSPPADAGALGAARHCAFLYGSSGLGGAHEYNFVNGVTSPQQCGNENARYRSDPETDSIAPVAGSIPYFGDRGLTLLPILRQW